MNRHLKASVQGIIETVCDNSADTVDNHDTLRLAVLLTADQLHYLIDWLRSLVNCENLDKVSDQHPYYNFKLVWQAVWTNLS